MRKILYIFVVLSLLAGCKRDKPLSEPNIDTIEMATDKYQLDYREQILTLEFKTNAEYCFEIGADWIVLTEDSRSMESYEQSFVVAENRTSDLRSTYIRVVAGEVEYMVTIEQSAKAETFNLTLRHSTQHLNSPEWSGENVRGKVDWGDDTKEEYTEGLSHDYPSSGRYSAMFEMENVEGFEIKRLGDIEHLDIEY